MPKQSRTRRDTHNAGGPSGGGRDNPGADSGRRTSNPGYPTHPATGPALPEEEIRGTTGSPTFEPGPAPPEATNRDGPASPGERTAVPGAGVVRGDSAATPKRNESS